jgi:ribonuclease T1
MIKPFCFQRGLTWLTTLFLISLVIVMTGCDTALLENPNSNTSSSLTTPALSNSTPVASTISTPKTKSFDAQQIQVNDLPKEALTTLQLIKKGGPFPYSKDGSVFNNYEGLLPKKSTGYYHEFTVVTPGSPDRGARRIISGESGEFYYTDDHYSSFKLIVE